MRAFIAFETPERITHHFRELQKQIVCDCARIVFPKTFHLTFLFLGEVSEDKIQEISKALSKVSFEPITVELDGTGVFPSEKRINVFWIALEPKKEISYLQRKIGDALGIRDERFHPHVTIARIKSVKNRAELKKVLSTIKPEHLSFTIDNFRLIKSMLTPEGPVYEVLKEYKCAQNKNKQKIL